MALTIKLPKDEAKEEYSVYINGNIIFKYTDEEIGTLLKINGTGVAFYSASNTRRAVIFQELSEPSFNLPFGQGKIPYVKQDVRIICKLKGRKVDLLKFMIYNLEKKYKKEIYSLDARYWLTIGSYIDSIPKNTSGSKKTQAYLITEKYQKWRKRLNEN